MTEEQYLSLCEKYLNGSCSIEDERLLAAYQEEKGLAKLDYTGSDADQIKALIKQNLQESIRVKKAKSKIIKLDNWKIVASIAASLLIIVYIGIKFLPADTNKPLIAVNKKSINKNKDILHPNASAILTLSTGERIELNKTKNGLISNSAIAKSGDALVISSNKNVKEINPEVLNTITIPRGGKYEITLPDGTRVWLNSASVLSFPSVFTGKERRVTLVGEAYFEVAKNKNMPFKVNVADKQEIEVLGTHFNVTAFPDDESIQTTLLEGSVKVNTKQAKVLIKPGEMAINNLKKLTVVDANVDEVMAWRSDLFIFNKENITAIMRKMSRWYDIDVEYQGNMDGINYEGNYSRAKGLKSLLANFELTDKVKFVIKERRITVIAK